MAGDVAVHRVAAGLQARGVERRRLARADQRGGELGAVDGELVAHRPLVDDLDRVPDTGRDHRRRDLELRQIDFHGPCRGDDDRAAALRVGVLGESPRDGAADEGDAGEEHGDHHPRRAGAVACFELGSLSAQLAHEVAVLTVGRVVVMAGGRARRHRGRHATHRRPGRRRAGRADRPRDQGRSSHRPATRVAARPGGVSPRRRS